MPSVATRAFDSESARRPPGSPDGERLGGRARGPAALRAHQQASPAEDRVPRAGPGVLAGAIVVEIGQPSDAFYLILGGRAKVLGKSRRTLGDRRLLRRNGVDRRRAALGNDRRRGRAPGDEAPPAAHFSSSSTRSPRSRRDDGRARGANPSARKPPTSEEPGERRPVIVVPCWPGPTSPPPGDPHRRRARAGAIGGRAVQIFTQSPRAWRPTNHPPENIERFKEARAEAGIGAVVCHALYLINLAATDEEVREKSRAALLQHGRASPARSRRTASSSTSAPTSATGFEAGLERAAPALERGARARAPTRPGSCSRTQPAPAGRSAARSTSSPRSSTASTAIRGSGSASTPATSGSPASTSPIPAAFDATLDEVDERIGLDRLRCLHVNDAAAELGSNRDRHANVGRDRWARALGVFLAHPRVQGLPAILETPGPDGHGPGRSRGRSASRTCTPARRELRGLVALLDDPEGRRPAGSSKNSGLTHPRSSARCW